jgi:hypothetical protein
MCHASGGTKHNSGAPGRTRTSDTWFRKPVLYPLSYGGTGAGHEENPAENPPDLYERPAEVSLHECSAGSGCTGRRDQGWQTFKFHVETRLEPRRGWFGWRAALRRARAADRRRRCSEVAMEFTRGHRPGGSRVELPREESRSGLLASICRGVRSGARPEDLKVSTVDGQGVRSGARPEDLKVSTVDGQAEGRQTDPLRLGWNEVQSCSSRGQAQRPRPQRGSGPEEDSSGSARLPTPSLSSPSGYARDRLE